MLETKTSKRIDVGDNDPRYMQILGIAKTLLHVAGTETSIFPKEERTSLVMASLNAATMIAFCRGMKSEHMRKALEDLIATMRHNVEETLQERGYDGP